MESRVGSISKNLDNSRVGIVGLGSAGSKIAVSLARSGVRNLLLVDIDLFFPENICRHELNWEDVGQHKVDGVTHLLRLIDPGMTVNSRKLMLSGQEASSGVSSALNALSQCALIIDATAQEDVFNLLSGVAFQSNTPYIWIQIFEGGIGGSLCRFRPKIEPPPKKIRACILEYFDRIERPKFKAAGNYAAIDESGKPIVATDADVAVIAGHATRMAIDLLSECQPSIFPYSVYLIGLSKGWIFKEPFYTIPIDLSAIKPDTSPTDCPAINAEDHVKFIKGLLDQK
ncbi:thiamine biosynthesis protein ThiF [Dehalococcoides mccartyi CG1]|nr:thiamine biosynthesis protein ThiF [Dehalococcoides mccartyi CG1]